MKIKKWSNSDPKGLRDWINNKGDYIGSAIDKLKQFKRIVRYFKRWRDVKFSSDVAREDFFYWFDCNGKGTI